MDCPSCPEITLGEVHDSLLMRLGTKRHPLGGSFDLTVHCNLDCVMCYIKQPAGRYRPAAPEMTLRQIRLVLDQLADAGCLTLLMTGGEPLCRPDFPDIWRYAKKKGMLVSLFTNGTLLTASVADLLAEFPPMPIEITLYGATQETYERVTRVPGSHERCMRGIELALEHGLRLNLKSVLLRANIHELDAMRSFAERLDVPYRFDGVLFPRLDGDQSSLDHRLEPSEVVALDRQYPERQTEFDRLYRGLGTVPVRSEYVYSCGAGQRSFHIDSQGRLSLCMMARRPAYDLLKGDFRYGWEEFLPVPLKEKRKQDTPCRTCSAGVMCMQCPGWSQLAHGDNETPVDFVCEMGILRAAQTVTSVGARVQGQVALERDDGSRMVVRTGPTD